MRTKTLLFITILYVSTSHIILPYLNDSNDFFFFALWNMYTPPPKKINFDISWNNNNVFLFRDRRLFAKTMGVDVHTLFYLLQKDNTSKVKSLFKEELLRLCNCESIYIVGFEGSLFNHIIKKEQPQILSEEAL